MAYKWDDKSVLQLVMKFQENEALWNQNHPDHRNRVKRAVILRAIGRALGTVRSEVERKLKNLTSHYYREKKVYDVRRATTGADVPEPKWFAYKALHFLQGKYVPRKKNSKTKGSKGETHTVSYSEPNHSNEEDSGPSSRAGTPRRAQNSAAAPLDCVRDEAGVFGEYIALKIRRMDPVTAATLQHRIQSIIYEADMGVYTGVATHAMQPEPSADAINDDEQFSSPEPFKYEHRSSAEEEEEWRSDHLDS